QRRHELRQSPSVKWSGGVSALNRLNRGRRQLAHWLAAAKTIHERLAVVGAVTLSQAPRDRWTMEGHQLTACRHECEQRRDVAVSDERLPGAPDLRAIEQRQQMRAAETATDRDDARNRRIAERFANRIRAKLRRTGNVG